MQLSILLAEQIGAMAIMLLFGFFMIKFHLLKSEDSKILSSLLIYAVVPCSLINSFQIDCTPDKLSGLLISIVSGLFLNLLLIGGAELLKKPLKLTPIEMTSVAYPNSGNLVIPLVAAVLGSEWVFYTSGYLIVQSVLLWTHAQSVLSGSKNFSIKKLLTNINILAILAGIVLFLTGFRFPGVIQSAFDGMASMMAPLSMIVIGMLLGQMDLKRAFTKKRIYFICFLRLIAFPLAATLLFAIPHLSSIHTDSYEIFFISLLGSSSSSAAMVTQLSQIYGGDAQYASTINVVSVIGCVFTIPIIAFIYQSVI